MEVTKLLAVCKIILSILIIFVEAEHQLKVINQKSYSLVPYTDELADVVQYDDNIDTIDLSKNGIGIIASRSFDDKSSTKLYTRKNQIKILNNIIFYNTGVRRINLQRNKIQRIDQGAFSALELERLDLSHNKLSHIDNDMFEGLIITGVLNLSFNQITKIRHLNVFNEKISSLFLKHNAILSIEQGAFNGMKVHRLDLSFNLLGIIESGTFEGLTTVDLNQGYWDADMEEGLTLSYNRIARIENDTFKGSTISTINLYGIREKVLNNKQFWGISESTKIFPDPLVDNEYPDEAEIFKDQYQDD